MVLNNPAGYLLNSAAASGAGAAFDTRNTHNYGYLWYATPAASAIVKVEASHDSSAWMTVGIYTATSTPATAQLAGYFPYVRGAVNACYSGGGNTGYARLFYAPGLI